MVCYDKKIISVLVKNGVTQKNGIICLAGFMRIISPHLIRKYRNRILNIHPALLPAYPGLDAQKKALRSEMNDLDADKKNLISKANELKTT